jgi:hypothetical protein
LTRNSGLFVALFTISITGCGQEAKKRAADDAWRDLHASMKRDNDELELENARLEYINMRTEFGDETAARWDKCLNDPPKQKANQASCKRLLAHIASVQAATAKADAAKKAKW